MANKRRPQGDVCDRCQWQMKGAKRSGSNLGCGEQTTDCDDRAEDMYAKEHQVNYHGIDKKQRREIRAKKQAQGHTMSW